LEIDMKRLALSLAVLTSLAAPVAAQTLTVLLPVISFPTEEIVPSTKGCDAQTATGTICQLQE